MSLECDYLVIGGGAMGMAFTDTLINETQDYTVIIVDKHAQPGGHWNDAYPFVRLHQPSQSYGVNSLRLERGPVPRDPKELAELASGQELVTYYRRVLDNLEATGRVRFLPMCLAEENPLRVVSLVNEETSWNVTARRKVVDATYMHVEVPSTRPPPFPIAPGALVVPPNSLPSISTSHPKYVVIGSGKTGIDAVLWLLRHHVPEEHLFWVMPRDAWLVNRAAVQPGRVIRFFLDQGADPTALAQDDDAIDMAMERVGLMHRIDEQRQPTASRCATVSSDELADLRRVSQIIRCGRVLEDTLHRTLCISAANALSVGESFTSTRWELLQQLAGIDMEPVRRCSNHTFRTVGLERLHLERGELATGAGTLHVDCTADGLARRPAVPIFSEGRITLQSVTTCQQVWSAAVLAHVEVKWPGEVDKQNQLCTPVPHPYEPKHVWESRRIGTSNMQAWLKNGLFWWMARSRLWMLSHEFTVSNALLVLSELARRRWRKPRAAAPVAKL